MTLLFWMALLSSMPIDTNAKECLTVSRGKELKQLVKKSNVLVILQEASSGDDEEESEEPPTVGSELCDRLKVTPEARVEDMDVVLVSDKILQTKVWSSSIAAPSDVLPSLGLRLKLFGSREIVPRW